METTSTMHNYGDEQMFNWEFEILDWINLDSRNLIAL